MNKSGPVIVIDDDPDDIYLFQTVFEELAPQREVLLFRDGWEAHHFLERSKVHPFFILSDVNLPKLTGFDCKTQIEKIPGFSALRVPYLFMSTSAPSPGWLRDNDFSCGFFVKPKTYGKLVELIRTLLAYWDAVYSPLDVV